VALPLLLVLAVCAAGARASVPPDDLDRIPPPFPYDTDFDDHLLHVHPEVNYAPHPDWVARWERARLGDGALLGTFGSSATDELLVDARWTLNPDLGGGLRLRNDIVWQEWRHLPHERQDIWLGLEQRVWRGFGVMAQAVPAEDKERIDVRAGVLWTSGDRRQYVQVLYRHDDLVHDGKSAREPTTLATPEGVDWLVRLERGAWSLYSRGRWLRRLEREYPDPERNPRIAAQAYAANEALVRLRWEPAPRTQLSVAWRQVEDAQRRAYRGASAVYDHDFSGRYRLLSLRGLLPLDDRWRLRGELHHLDRHATVSGYRALDHHRRETLPALWGEWRFGRGHWLELGYLGTAFRWTDTARGDDEGWGDKVELGLVFALARGSSVKLSLSHEVSEGDFGGANVRLVGFF
jgi:hypothetical protein